MINKDRKQLIADYMNWSIVNVGTKKRPYVLYVDTINCNIYHHFNANSASLCVAEMQKRGDWQKFCATGFVIYFEKERPSHVFPENYIAWLFNAENFFEAFTEWRKGK